jgi:predicted nucleotidyltransferase
VTQQEHPPAEEAGNGVSFDKETVPEEQFLAVLDDAVAAMERSDVPYVFIGSIPTVLLGQPRWSEREEDIDFFVKREDARSGLEALARAGFATQETHPQWLYKGKKDGVVIDIIFRSSGDVYLDDAMLERAVEADFKGRKVKLGSPEDMALMKALAHSRDTPTYWHDAVGILSQSEIDWDYLVSRALRHGARRMLSLLIYAESNDLVVPDWVIEKLVSEIYGK